MKTRKDLTRQIRNARRRLERLKQRRSDGPEAREMFENAPLAQNAVNFIEHLDKKINEEKELIARLIRKRARAKSSHIYSLKGIRMKEIVIGPSNGWLYAKDIFSLRKHREFLKKAGANAIEFCGTEDDRRKESLLSDEEIGELRHVSLHLPDYKSSKSINDQVSSIRKIVRRRKPRHCLIHPLKIPSDYWEALANRNIPVVIENMDKRKFSGYDLKELEGLLKDFELGFVLDVQDRKSVV